MNPIEHMGASLDPMEVRVLLLEQAEQLHVHGDFADAAITGARRIRTRRAVAAVVAGALAIALPFGLAFHGDGARRTDPARRDSTPRVAVTPAPAQLTALVRSGPPEGPMPIPYIQAGVLQLNGRRVTLPIARDDPIRFFATLSNGGVVYQVAGPNPDAPDFEVGPVTFLDVNGHTVRRQELAQVDVNGLGDVVNPDVAGTVEPWRFHRTSCRVGSRTSSRSAAAAARAARTSSTRGPSCPSVTVTGVAGPKAISGH